VTEYRHWKPEEGGTLEVLLQHGKYTRKPVKYVGLVGEISPAVRLDKFTVEFECLA